MGGFQSDGVLSNGTKRHHLDSDQEVTVPYGLSYQESIRSQLSLLSAGLEWEVIGAEPCKAVPFPSSRGQTRWPHVALRYQLAIEAVTLEISPLPDTSNDQHWFGLVARLSSTLARCPR